MLHKLLSQDAKILLIGERTEFNAEIQSLLQQYPLVIESAIPQEYHGGKYAVIILAPSYHGGSPPKAVSKRCFVVSFSKHCVADIQITQPVNLEQFEAAIGSAIDYYLTKSSFRTLEKQHLIVSKERKKLSAIGVALSAEKDLDHLLGMVLKEGRSLGKCEGASLYLIEQNAQGDRELVFKLTQNSKISFDFQEVRFPLTSRSLAGYVALQGEPLNIKDVYQLDHTYPFSFDESFDNKVGYRTRELLVLPMRNHKGKIIGVLQFVNTFGSNVIEELSDEAGSHVGFPEETCDILAGLASQAAVAIDNTHLIENIQNLFEGFVSASVNAIESRDPVTSGHSFRVAKLTTGLAEMLDSETSGVHKNLSFNSEQIREIRYASLLHDFGKVGVKENVLLKANKLHASRFQYLELKIEWQKQVLQKKFYQQLLNQETTDVLSNLRHESISQLGLQNHSGYKSLLMELEKLDDYRRMLFQANQPSIMEGNVAHGLAEMAEYRVHEEYPFSDKLISDGDFLSLSILKGSLTEKDRVEIQSHVINTQTFLERIPWTDELSSIPQIAGAHHEKLDGSGYPLGLKANEIPIASKIMTIADIFDALTAQDRPYKKAVKLELALDILVDEAKRHKIDSDILSTFIDSKIYKCVSEL